MNDILMAPLLFHVAAAIWLALNSALSAVKELFHRRFVSYWSLESRQQTGVIGLPMSEAA